MQSDHYDDNDDDDYDVNDEFTNGAKNYNAKGGGAAAVAMLNHCSSADDADTATDDDDWFAVGGTEVKINDTYVIRKGGKQRASVLHQFSPIDDFAGASNVAIVAAAAAAAPVAVASSSINASLAVSSAADKLCTTNAKFVSSIRVPFTRHSIDLGGAGTSGPDAKHAARTRLSLDLGSPPPTVSPASVPTKLQQPSAPSPTTPAPATYPYGPQQQQHQQQHAAVNGNNNNNAKAVLSPRYSEFKKYKSTFDAFYALDVTNSNNQQKQQQHQQYQQHQHQYQYQNNNAVGMRSTEALDEDHIHQYNQQHYGTQPQTVDGGSAALMRVSSLPTISPAISGKFLYAHMFTDRLLSVCILEQSRN